MLVAVEHETATEYGLLFRNRGDLFWVLQVLEGRWRGYEPGPLFAIAWPRLAQLPPPVSHYHRRRDDCPVVDERRQEA